MLTLSSADRAGRENRQLITQFLPPNCSLPVVLSPLRANHRFCVLGYCVPLIAKRASSRSGHLIPTSLNRNYFFASILLE